VSPRSGTASGTAKARPRTTDQQVQSSGSIPAEKKALIAGAAADLDARDPEFIRRQLSGAWLLASTYFRAEVRGFERVPEDEPVLFVSNHSGGNMSPDSMVFMLAFCTYFGVERDVYALAHSMVTSWPVIGRLGRKWGVITAGREAAKAAFARGACVLVYPGGDVETHRPWAARHEIRFDGRKGFLKLAKEAKVPIVPVVASGGQQTFLPLTDGRWIAKTLRLDRLGRLKVLPISIALPWGINVGDLLGHLPLPVKIRMEVCEPIDTVKMFGTSGADSDEAFDYVTTKMQEVLTTLSAERVLPPA
jgi:1-acyl-sn-glycerol-3-phosphate acyltransferase